MNIFHFFGEKIVKLHEENASETIFLKLCRATGLRCVIDTKSYLSSSGLDGLNYQL